MRTFLKIPRLVWAAVVLATLLAGLVDQVEACPFGRVRARIRARWGGRWGSSSCQARCTGPACRVQPADMAPVLPAAPTVVPAPEPPTGAQSASADQPDAPRIDTSSFQNP